MLGKSRGLWRFWDSFQWDKVERHIFLTRVIAHKIDINKAILPTGRKKAENPLQVWDEIAFYDMVKSNWIMRENKWTIKSKTKGRYIIYSELLKEKREVTKNGLSNYYRIEKEIVEDSKIQEYDPYIYLNMR